jgi:hypothetical protein
VIIFGNNRKSIIFVFVMSQTKLELTKIEPTALLDADTFDAYSNGTFTQDVVELNRELFKGKEIVVDGVYFAINSTDVGNFIHPYRFSVRRTMYYYAFMGYDTTENALYWFFQGVSKTNDRAKAQVIYNALIDYCNQNSPTIKPYMIKR